MGCCSRETALDDEDEMTMYLPRVDRLRPACEHAHPASITRLLTHSGLSASDAYLRRAKSNSPSFHTRGYTGGRHSQRLAAL